MSKRVIRRPSLALRRNDDPENSHVAAENWWPTGESCLERCMELLERHHGEWINATDFIGPEVGGLNATRRLRELREQDDRIETRLAPGTSNIWQWRLRRDASPRFTPLPSSKVRVRQPRRRGRSGPTASSSGAQLSQRLSPEERRAQLDAKAAARFAKEFGGDTSSD